MRSSGGSIDVVVGGGVGAAVVVGTAVVVGSVGAAATAAVTSSAWTGSEMDPVARIATGAMLSTTARHARVNDVGDFTPGSTSDVDGQPVR